MSILVVSSIEASNFESFYECRAIESDVERLECFDTTIDGLCETHPCSNKNDKPTGDIPDSSTAADETLFGLTKNPVEKEIEKIESSIKDIRFAAYGKHVFTLENGQVWMENEPGRKKVKNTHQKVMIRKKGLRYLISFESGISLSVHRIK